MNVVPKEATRLAPAKMKTFVSGLFQKSGVPPAKANFLADLLVGNDLRGTFSHGTRQAATYIRLFRDGILNPDSQVRVVSESPTTVLIDGDGGLGYFPSHMAATAVAERARKNGIAAAVTRNHGHFGAAGIYSRIIVAQDLIAYVTSGHQLLLKPEQSILAAAGGSPMSFAVPAGEAPPMVLDFGAMHDMYESAPHVQELFKLAPGSVFRAIGLGAMCQALGGFLAGVPVETERAVRSFSGANQGSLMIALDIERFMDLSQFKSEMDAYMRVASGMQPMPGYERATLPGVLEWEREREWAEAGIPVGAEHREVLSRAAAEFGVETPF